MEVLRSRLAGAAERTGLRKEIKKMEGPKDEKRSDR